ncbi:MAG: tetraacyldisaccharide 4'-kinase [Beijerinckiaceae bacterium]|jgi:tetraacyldisaccharide 4'-kinase|nr:tetraacyldisaccharide 4'-kinase [Beijerinckiaceae bacterium]
MRAPAFWWRSSPSLLALLLSPIGWIWGEIAGRRMQRSGQDADARVLCIGNFTAGGAGKTPTALACAAILSQQGYKPAFLTRGYGGTLARDGAAHQVDLRSHLAGQAGDEPLLLAVRAPTYIASDRLKGANAATAMGADVLVMDDGLQNPGLNKDLTLVVADGETGIGNGLCIPAGPLRAPLALQWPKAGALVLIGSGEAGNRLAQQAVLLGKPVFRASLEPDPDVIAQLRGKRVIAFAGIGRPDKFFATLQNAGIEIVDAFAFADHQTLDFGEIALLQKTALEMNAHLVTTEKDFARVGADFDTGTKPLALPVTLLFEDPSGFTRFMMRALGSTGAAGGRKKPPQSR